MTINIEQLKRPRIQPYAFNVKSSFKSYGIGMNVELLGVIEWVILEIGTIKSARWEIRFSSTNISIYFKHEEDATAFKLRWS